METKPNQGPLAFNDVLNGLPGPEQGAPSFNTIMQDLPSTAPAGFETAPEPTDNNPVWDWFTNLLPDEAEKNKVTAANLVAASELTGKPLHEIAADEGTLLDFYKKPDVGEALKIRSESIQRKFDGSRKAHNASIAFADAYQNGDQLGQDEALAAYKEASAMKQDQGTDLLIGKTEKWIYNSVADLTGQIWQTMSNAKGYAAGGAGIGAGLGATAGGVGALPGAIGGATAAGGYGMLIDMYKSSLGNQTIAKMEGGMDDKLAFYTSIPTAGVIALSERLQLSMFVKNIPGVKGAVAKGLGKAGKEVEEWTFKKFGLESAKAGLHGSGQEAAQSIVEQMDIEITKAISNELYDTNLDKKTIEEIAKEVKDTFVQVLPGMLFMGGFGNATASTADTLNRKADERKALRMMDTGVQHTPQTDPQAEPEQFSVVDDLGQPVNVEETVPFDEGQVLSEDGDSIPSAPLSEAEIAAQETGFEQSPISNEEFDNLVMLPDEDLDAGLEDALYSAMKSGERYGDFISGVRGVLGRKQAGVIEGLIKARARATGRTKEQFADDYQLAFRTSEGDADTMGSVEFIEDGETIVRSFANTDLRAVTHEVAHIFRKDLTEQELSAAEKEFGVKNGEWNKQAEEDFAEGFIEYMATGKAPSKKIAKTFEKFRYWLSATYNTLKNDGVKVSPQMEKIFSEMLAGTQQKRFEAGIQEVKKSVQDSVLFSKASKIKGQIRKATGQTPTRAQVAVDEFVALKESLKKQVQVARKAAAEGNKDGYARGQAKAKAVVQRAKNRSAVNKSRGKIRKSITKMVKSTKVKTQAGKPKGKFTADFQLIANSLRDIMTMPVREARAQAIKRQFRSLPEDFGSDIDTMRHFLLMTRANMGQMDEVALTQLHDDLKGFLESGKAMRDQEIGPRMARIAEAKAKLVEGLQNKRESLGDEEHQRNFYDEEMSKFQKVKDFIRNNGMLDFHGLMERLDMGLDAVFGEGNMRGFTETLDAENQSNTGRREMNTRMLSSVAEALGLKNEDGTPSVKMAERALWEEERQTPTEVGSYEILLPAKKEKDKETGETITHPQEKSGKTRKIQRSKAELRKLFMELQDPDLKADWIADGMTQEIEDAIRGALTDADMNIIKAQFEIYNEYYDKVNAVYRVLHGTDLPRNKFYSPILRDTTVQSENGPISDLLQDMRGKDQYVGAGSTALKTRVGSKEVTTARSDIATLNNYIRQMEHFMAFGPIVQEWNGLFKDKDVRREIADTMGKDFLQTVDDTIINIARNGSRAGDAGKDQVLIRQLRGNLAKGLVGLKALAVPKQLTSFLAFSESITMDEFGTGMVEFMKEPMAKAREMKEMSQFLQNRGDNIERDISMIANGSEFQGIAHDKIPPSLQNMIMAFVRAGDIGAMYAGGWAYYSTLRKQGLSQEEAIRKFELQARNTQQSSELGSQSRFQQGNEWMKLFTMFTTSQRQYAQVLALSLEARANDNLSNKEFTKKALIYAVALPVLFQVVAQGGMSDEDDFKNALKSMLASPMSPIPIAGQAGNFLLSGVINGHTYGRGAGSMSVFSPIESFYKGVRKLYMDDITMRDTLMAMRDMAAVVEYMGLPGRQIGNVAVGIEDATHGEFNKGVLEAAGMSPYSAGKRISKLRE